MGHKSSTLNRRCRLQFFLNSTYVQFVIVFISLRVSSPFGQTKGAARERLLSRLISRAARAGTFHHISQMGSLLAGNRFYLTSSQISTVFLIFNSLFLFSL